MGLKARVQLALAVTALAAAPAAGQDFVYYNACGNAAGTSLRVCASADVSLVGNTLVMRVWNMEVDGAIGTGSYGTEFGGWHVINAIGLEYRGTGNGAGGSLSGARYVFGGGAGDYTSLQYWHGVDAGGRNPLKVELGSSSEGHREGIVGCTDPGPTHANHVMTCGSYGFMPFVEFTFTNVDPRINLRRYDFAFHGTQMYGGLNAKVYSPGTPTEVVPEPITMGLLGSGLVGVGGVGLRRRKKELGSDA